MSFASRRNAGTPFPGGPISTPANTPGAPLSSALLGGAVPATNTPGTAPPAFPGMPATTQPGGDMQSLMDVARQNPAQPNPNLQQLLQQAQQPQPQADPSAPAFDPQQWQQMLQQFHAQTPQASDWQAMLQKFQGMGSPMSPPTSNPWFPSQGIGSTGSGGGTAVPWWLNRG